MPRKSDSIPTYRKHKQSGQAIVTLTDGAGNRRDVLLGEHGSKVSRIEYARVIAEWESTGRCFHTRSHSATDMTVNEVIMVFWRHAEKHYRRADGTATNELGNFKVALRPLRKLYGHTVAAKFGPLELKAIRQQLLVRDISRGTVNRYTAKIKSVFKWAVGEGLVPANVFHGLQCVAALQRGRCEARETAPVKPVPNAFVDAVRPYVLPVIWSMIEVQRLTGARPGEVCDMRACDIDMTGKTWLYRPAQHKTAHHGRERIVPIGPKAQFVLRPYLTMSTTDHLFSPRQAMECKAVFMRSNRKSPVQPSQANRRRRKPKWVPGEKYATTSYARAIARGCQAADDDARERATEESKLAGTKPPAEDYVFVPHWHPNRLRHNYATMIRKQFGIEGAQVALGHARAEVTQIYAERDQSFAERIAAEVG